MLEAAVSARADGLMLLGVTVLTSSNAETLREIGVNSSVEEQVLRLASLGKVAQINGFVASPQELKALRARLGDEAKLVVTGVRPVWSHPGYQQRFMTPRDPLPNGAHYLVNGRTIPSHRAPSQPVPNIFV